MLTLHHHGVKRFHNQTHQTPLTAKLQNSWWYSNFSCQDFKGQRPSMIQYLQHDSTNVGNSSLKEETTLNITVCWQILKDLSQIIPLRSRSGKKRNASISFLEMTSVSRNFSSGPAVAASLLCCRCNHDGSLSSLLPRVCAVCRSRLSARRRCPQFPGTSALCQIPGGFQTSK